MNTELLLPLLVAFASEKVPSALSVKVGPVPEAKPLSPKLVSGLIE